MIYRRIPREIEAFQYDGNVKDSNGKYYIPDWAIKPFEDGTMYFDNKERKKAALWGIHKNKRRTFSSCRNLSLQENHF